MDETTIASLRAIADELEAGTFTQSDHSMLNGPAARLAGHYGRVLELRDELRPVATEPTGDELRWEGSEYHTSVRILPTDDPHHVTVRRCGKGGGLTYSALGLAFGRTLVFTTDDDGDVTAMCGAVQRSSREGGITVWMTADLEHGDRADVPNIETALVGLAFRYLS